MVALRNGLSAVENALTACNGDSWYDSVTGIVEKVVGVFFPEVVYVRTNTNFHIY